MNVELAGKAEALLRNTPHRKTRRAGRARAWGVILVLLGMIVAGGLAHAQPAIRPTILHYEGYLADGAGHPIPDRTRSMTFRIYDVETGGVPLWSETQDLPTKEGSFDAVLGIVSPLTVILSGPCWLGIQLEQEPERTPRVRLANTEYQFNADMVDGCHAFGTGYDWKGSGYSEGLSKRRNIQLRGDFGPADLYVPIVHFWPFRIVLTCAHAAPRVGDVAFIECVENDGMLSCLGVDGSGGQVRCSLSLESNDRILSVREGHITLSCPGDGSRRLKVHTDGEWALGYMDW
jgi:hypothetical protein